MYLTEKEIFAQPESLEKTFTYIMKNKEKLLDYSDIKGITYIGSGSSYSICKSAAMSINRRMNIKVNAISAGDMLVNFSQYDNIIRDTIIITVTRSGSTSEVLNVLKLAKERYNTKSIAICMVADAPVSNIADFTLELPWAFDESVCQTRCVTNLYAANLMLVSLLSGDKELQSSISTAINMQKDFMSKYKSDMQKIAALDWDNAIVLADCELEGIAEEGALAFKEICQLKSNYYHLLDSRHGPMVLFDEKTLVIAVKSPYEDKYQSDYIREIKEKNNAIVVCISDLVEGIDNADFNIFMPDLPSYAASGILFITICQMISFYKAIATGIDPDYPNGLDPWIEI